MCTSDTPRTHFAVLNHNAVYTETLRVRPLDALPGSLELVVVSRLATARQPDAEQVRWRSVISAARLRTLAQALLTAADTQGVKP
jgi:hypothetical protein